MSLGFTTLPNFVHVKLEMCQGKGLSIKDVKIYFAVFDKVQRTDLTCDVIKKLAPFVLSKL